MSATHTPTPSAGHGAPPRGHWLALVGWIMLPVAVGLVGAMFQPGEWYAGLQKPPWNPPNSVFGPVWTALYIAMGVAAWRVWRHGGWARQRQALALFLAQLAANAIWTPLFFGAQALGWALADLVLIIVLATLTARRFWAVDRIAGGIFVPYLAWLLYASSLNAAILWLNR